MNKGNKFEYYFLSLVFCRDSTTITSSSEYKTTFDGREMKLIIESAKFEYEGIFKVVVSNESGKDESSAKLTVEVSLRCEFFFETIPRNAVFSLIIRMFELRVPKRSFLYVYLVHNNKFHSPNGMYRFL